MKHEYTDIKGLKIPDKRMVDLYKDAGTDENAVSVFLGDKMKLPGFVFYLLEHMSTSLEWIRLRG